MNDKWKSLMEKLSKKKPWKVSKKSNKVKWWISVCLNLTRNKVPRKEKLQLQFSQIYGTFIALVKRVKSHLFIL